METALRTDITIDEICKGFVYNELEGKGLFGLSGKLVIQPEYQRNYLYAEAKMEEAVIRSVLKKYPLLSELYALTKEFCNVLFSNNPAKLDEWINEAQKYDIPELQTFINGIKKDLTAVKNGIIYSYNNGLAEGSVNKIKVIKRIMYGRNSFELLKAKVLFGELFHVKFN